MPANESKLTIQTQDEITLIGFIDRNILDEASIHQIGQEITDLIEASPNPKLLIDFNNVDHLSSAALGTLITVNNKVRQKDGQLRLTNIDAQIYEVFVITKLNKLFNIQNNRDEALKSFS